MRGRKGLLLLALALTFVLGTVMTSVPMVKAEPGPVKLNAVYRTAAGYYPGQAYMTWLYVHIDIESPYAWDLTRDGIIGYDFDCHVDPAVLRPWSAHAATFGYFLYDFIDWNMLGATHYPSILVGSVDQTGGHFYDIAEFIMGYGFPEVDPALLDKGAGGNSTDPWWYGGTGTLGNGLCMLRFRVMSTDINAYSFIDIDDAGYWTMDPVTGKGVRHAIPDSDITDGHYNAPPVPEFPLGAAVEIGLIVAVAYIWWTRRRKLREVP